MEIFQAHFHAIFQFCIISFFVFCSNNFLHDKLHNNFFSNLSEVFTNHYFIFLAFSTKRRRFWRATSAAFAPKPARIENTIWRGFAASSAVQDVTCARGRPDVRMRLCVSIDADERTASGAIGNHKPYRCRCRSVIVRHVRQVGRATTIIIITRRRPPNVSRRTTIIIRVVHIDIYCCIAIFQNKWPRDVCCVEIEIFQKTLKTDSPSNHIMTCAFSDFFFF